MAVSATLGAATFNLLLGIGGSGILHYAKEGSSIPIPPSVSVALAVMFVMALAVLSVIVVPLMGYSLSKKYAILLFVTYGLFLVLAFLDGFGVIGNAFWIRLN